MSADNWAICPRCRARREKALADRAEQVQAMYGKESLDDFDRARQKLATDLATTLDQTFREDYEIHGAADGAVHVSYHGGCSKCGLTLNFEHVHALDVDGAE